MAEGFDSPRQLKRTGLLLIKDGYVIKQLLVTPSGRLLVGARTIVPPHLV